MRGLRVWLLLLAASLKGQMSYRSSFLLEVVGRFAVTTLELVAVLVLFTHVDGLGGWTRWEVVYLYGVASLSLGLAELFTDGLRDMPELIRLGTFDGILVRPVAPLAQVLGRQCRPLHLGRAAQGGLALGLAFTNLDVAFGLLELTMLVVNIASSVVVFSGIFIAGAATGVFTVDSAEAFNAFTYGGVQMTQYPLPIYRPWLRWLFVFAVPVGYTSYFPALVVLGKDDALGFGPLAPWMAPVVAAAFLGLSTRWWAFAVNHYRSTGS